MSDETRREREEQARAADDGLRTLPPSQEVRRSTWSRLRYVPFVLLVALVVAATAAGIVWEVRHPLPDGAVESTAAPGEPLPAACTPAYDRELEGEPWVVDAAAASEATYQEHVAETSGMIVAGQDGQWFFGDANVDDFSQALGREPLDDERLDAWAAYVNNMRAELAAIDVPLYVVFAPAKWEILHDDLPEWAQPLRGEVRLDQLLAAHPDLPIVDVRAAVAEAHETAPTYTPRNSHWTNWGAYAAFGQLADCMAATDDRLADLEPPAVVGTSVIPDFDEYGPLGATGSPGLDWAVPTYEGPVPEMTMTLADGTTEVVQATTPIDMERLPATTTTPDAPVDLDVLMVGDSTGTMIGPVLQSTFTETTQIRHNLDHVDAMPDVALAASDTGADVAILLVTERYLQIVPGAEIEP